MARIEPLESPFAPELQKQFSRLIPQGMSPLLLFRTVARSPRAWNKLRGGSLLDDGPLSLREREIVINRTCARTGCAYEWGVHVTVFAEIAGLTVEEVGATTDLPASLGRWPPREAALIAAVDALHDRATLTDSEFQQLREHFRDDQILEVLMLAGFYRMVSYLANGLALPLEAGCARFVEARIGEHR
jgi:alkylhydroperoxidase family enzyme